jgi:hypothetical protein
MKETLDDLDWALGFWREERPAKPTTKAVECAACLFRKICESSIVRSSALASASKDSSGRLA